MSNLASATELLQRGMQAIKQGQALEGINLLVSVCELEGETPSATYYQAQMWLVRAYREAGYPDYGISLCRQMTQYEEPKIRAWAERTLPTLLVDQPSTTPEPSPDQPSFVETQFVSQLPLQSSASSSVQLSDQSLSVHAAGELEETQFLPQSPLAPPSMAGMSPEQSNFAPIDGAGSLDESAFPDEPPLPSEALTPADLEELLKTGNKALKQKNYSEAIVALSTYCEHADPEVAVYAQAQMSLAKAYKASGQDEEAIALARQLVGCESDYIKAWAKQLLGSLAPNTPIPASSTSPPSPTETSAIGPQIGGDHSPQGSTLPKAGRSMKRGAALVMKGVAASLSLASGVTISLLLSMVFALSLALVLIVGSPDPLAGLVMAILLTIVINLAAFFLSPFLMDFIQGFFYNTRWTTINEVERLSPESARVIREVCQQKNLKTPRLGIIEDQNPTAFTYGSLPNSARLVVSQGLFTYLDDDEAATVYAHELGHIVHWDFAVMTLAATLVQICYLIYVYLREFGSFLGDNDLGRKAKQAGQTAAMTAYFFYIIGEYLVLYLSRTREYYADHFAAEVTGNPNGLSRALVKIAYGLLEQGKRSNQQPSRVIEGTRTLGILDPRSAAFTGTAYRVATDPKKVGRVFLWDLFNPWAWWMELNSTHPLTGKRVRALTTYAEQLGLPTEFEMAAVIREGRTLSRQRLYGGFVLDLVMMWADILGLILGFVAVATYAAYSRNVPIMFSLIFFGYGFGLLLKTLVIYPDFNRAPETDIMTLMSDPYASPLRGKPARLKGRVIGRGDSGYQAGSDLKFQDLSGMIFLHYSSFFGPIGNLIFGLTRAEHFINQPVKVLGWFRRGIMPSMDLIRMDSDSRGQVNSYHRLWSLLLSLGSIMLGFAIPALLQDAR